MNLVYALAADTEKAEMKSKVKHILTDHFMSPLSQDINISDIENRNEKRDVVDDTDDFV